MPWKIILSGLAPFGSTGSTHDTPLQVRLRCPGLEQECVQCGCVGGMESNSFRTPQAALNGPEQLPPDLAQHLNTQSTLFHCYETICTMSNKGDFESYLKETTRWMVFLMIFRDVCWIPDNTLAMKFAWHVPHTAINSQLLPAWVGLQ